MNKKTSHRWIVIVAAVMSAGFLFAVGETPTLIEEVVNYPNPFDSRREDTTISYRLTQDLPVRVRIYDLFGYQVRELYFGTGSTGGRQGVNTFSWDGTDSTGQKVSKGGYICMITVEGDQPTRTVRKIGVLH